MEYQLIDSPYPLYCDFGKFDKEQAKGYFQWYVSSIPKRIANLTDYIHNVEGVSVDMDFSIESLIPLWEWFEPHIKWILLTEEEQQQRVIGLTERQAAMILQNSERLTDNTEKLIFDIAAYYAEIFLKHNSRLHWGYNKTAKRNMFYNRPALYDGPPSKSICIEPRHLVHVAAVNSSKKERCSERLYDVYNIHIKELSRSTSN